MSLPVFILRVTPGSQKAEPCCPAGDDFVIPGGFAPTLTLHAPLFATVLLLCSLGQKKLICLCLGLFCQRLFLYFSLKPISLYLKLCPFASVSTPVTYVFI